ncbi:hypothetical protein WN943_024722 [Citrus x changshan-huyou]
MQRNVRKKPMPKRTNYQRHVGDKDEDTMHTSYNSDKDQEIFAEVVENVDLEKLVKKAHYAELQRRSKSTVNAKSADSVKQP